MTRDEIAALAWVACGGALGALARAYGPFSTFWINVIGCAVIGLAMPLIGTLWTWRYTREFVTVGMCGGFTTFSGYFLAADHAGDTTDLVVYLVAGAAACLVAVAIGSLLSRRLVR